MESESTGGRGGVLGSFDVVVIGGGHAGAEAASASARLGCSTLLVTPDLGRIGQMSCNPAIGGVAKGTVAREVDALGGIMGVATDRARLHFRMLNQSRGPAVWGPRAQCDRSAYAQAVREALEAVGGLSLFQGTVEALVVERDARGEMRVEGVRLGGGIEVPAKAVVVTAGTFLRGRIHLGGKASEGGGRAGESAVEGLSHSLESVGIDLQRFKTGTPPRIDGRSVDFSRLERQDGERPEYRFSFWAGVEPLGELPCWLTWTGAPLRRIVEASMHRSALHGGEISGRGPRYCPSIEDKVVRFPGAERHKVFLEPEGLRTSELYVNGLSTSLPADVQRDFLRTLPGLEEVRITRLGYAVEYDFLPPQQLRSTLELRRIPGLYTAGQVNGTTGYEEAAGQGVVAGINAALRVQGRAPWVPGRHEAYLGVLVDDLVTRGVDEPYRLFTSRAEFRLLLRQDNAPERMSAQAAELGLLQGDALARWEERRAARQVWQGWMSEARVRPGGSDAVLEGAGTSALSEPTPLSEVARRPQLHLEVLYELGRRGSLAPPLPVRPPHGGPRGGGSRDECLEGLILDARYAGYREREEERASRFARLQGRSIPDDFDYFRCETLSMEARQQLSRACPETLAQAGAVRGVRAADVQSLALALTQRPG